MTRPPYILDARTSDDVYADALRLARQYLPEWAGFWPPSTPDYFSTDDPGLVLLKLMARLHSSLSTQLNRAPDKHFLTFLDFFGVELRGPQAARVPLTFTLTAGSGPVELPANTQVASANDANLLFETTQPLLALPARLVAGYVLSPAADTYATAPSLLGQPDAGAPALVPLEHALSLGSSTLFQQSTPVEELSVTLQGVNLFQSYFARWTDGTGTVLRPQFTPERYDILTVSFTGFSQTEATEVAGRSSFWLTVRPSEDVRIRGADAEVLPQLTALSATVRSPRLQAEATFTNGTAVDMTKGGNPFGQMPAVEDAFYIASTDVFSRVGASISIDIDATPIDPPTSVVLAWEYWDEGWLALDVLDGTAAFTRPGRVTFTCPPMAMARINGRDSRWVRARIASGGYGLPGGIVVVRSAEYVVDDLIGSFVTDRGEVLDILNEHQLNFGYEYQPPSYVPPYVAALWLRYELTERPELAITRNGFADAPLDLLPYQPVPEQQSAYYLGFEPTSFLAHVRGRTLSLLALLPSGRQWTSTLPPVWSAFDGSTWRVLKVQDGTNDFTTSGIVKVEVPAWVTSSSAFGQELAWLRLSAPEDTPTALPPLQAVVPNAADAVNGVRWTDEVLGSGTGGPGLTVEFPRTPVLEGQGVEVFEALPIAAQALPGGQPLAGAAGAQTWVTWEEVSSFSFSSATDRHYVLDHASGVLTFGDGVRGMAPPPGENNIRASQYRSGGGLVGNQPAGSLTMLQRALPGVDSVTNVIASRGGTDADTLDALRTLGPRRLKARDRAVSAEDFATLALTCSQRVGRATAYAELDGRLSVAVVPREFDPRPTVTSDLVDEVEAYLRPRAPFVVVDALSVVGPEYLPIDVFVRAVLQPDAQKAVVRTRMEAFLTRFFAPLGGPGREGGWDFGATVLAADVAQALEDVQGVAIIDGVALNGGSASVPLVRAQLPCAGALSLEVSHGG
ncbi:putative baseplate assembly protein [Corallococcus exercitus]|uniref:putative baseplate assembly protein n=1 Tax=Corallococcus exercitus TaxID=2316736 RepID=UPI000EA055AD|nr:putative baseplate assembly protein [Corallococcus exercitus]RKG79686.1 putative baseplate assembly protein [Corallococcus exercitus]